MPMTSDGDVCITALTTDPDATRRLAARLGEQLSGGEVIALRGDLGAGKTVFVQGLAHGLGAGSPVTSPSFVLVHRHAGRLALWHVDLYRLEAEGAAGLGLEDLVAPEAVVAIEWAERLPRHLAEMINLEVAIEFGPGECERHLRLCLRGAGRARLREALVGLEAPAECNSAPLDAPAQCNSAAPGDEP